MKTKIFPFQFWRLCRCFVHNSSTSTSSLLFHSTFSKGFSFIMEENTSAASQESPVSGGEVSERKVITGRATDTETGMKRKRCHGHADRHVDAESSPLALASSSFSVTSSANKRRRGRPKGSGKLQLLASLGGYFAETAGGNFSPHVVIVKTGEDIARKVISLLQRPPRAALCILSVTGMVSKVVMRQPGSPGGLLTFEGCFEILSLSGSFRYGEVGSTNRVVGMLSIKLAKPDGDVFGGIVGGSLVADGPIQLIVATFKQNIIKEFKRRTSSESSTAASRPGDSDMVRVLKDVARMTEDIENCTIPTIAPLTLSHEGVDTVISENQKSSLASPHNVNIRVQQHISDQRMHTKRTGGQNLSPTASVPTVDDENALQPISEKGASPHIVTAKNSSPASSPPSIVDDALKVLQPSSEQESCSNTAMAENKKSVEPSLNSIAPNS